MDHQICVGGYATNSIPVVGEIMSLIHAPLIVLSVFNLILFEQMLFLFMSVLEIVFCRCC